MLSASILGGSVMMPAIIINTCRGQDVGWGVFQSRQQQAHAENVAPGGPKLSPNPPPAPGPGGGRPETQLGQEPLSLAPHSQSLFTWHFGTLGKPAGTRLIQEALRRLPRHMKYWRLWMNSSLIVNTKAIKVLGEN